jgi:hypothetical protein
LATRHRIISSDKVQIVSQFEQALEQLANLRLPNHMQTTGEPK